MTAWNVVWFIVNLLFWFLVLSLHFGFSNSSLSLEFDLLVSITIILSYLSIVCILFKLGYYCLLLQEKELLFPSMFIANLVENSTFARHASSLFVANYFHFNGKLIQGRDRFTFLLLEICIL